MLLTVVNACKIACACKIYNLQVYVVLKWDKVMKR